MANVIGLDYSGISDTLISAQVFTSFLTKDHEDIVRDRVNSQLSFLFRQQYFNNTLTLETLGIYSLNDKDSSLQVRLDYLFGNDLTFSAGIDTAMGNREGLFGQFDHNDRFILAINWNY